MSGVPTNNRGLEAALIEARAERERAERALAAANATHQHGLHALEAKTLELSHALAEQVASHSHASGGAAALRFARDSARELVLSHQSAHALAMQNLARADLERECAAERLTERLAAERAIEIALERRQKSSATERERRASDG